MPECPDSRRKLFEKVSSGPPSQTLWNKPSEETTLFWKSGFSSEPPSLKNRSLLLRIRVIFTNSVALGLPLQKLMNTSFMQKMSQGAIGVKTPPACPQVSATCPP
jgi:hypothetical protein